MNFFYDGQTRRYVNQIIRMLSGFKYQTSDGKQYTVPVMYGDMTRQVASIIRDNSSNKIPSAPRIAVYITGIQLDRNRLGDSTFVSKVHVRERTKTYDDAGNLTGYGNTQGENYTVERLMPTPYKLTVKADIWASNTEQKLQIMEQIWMLFNPSIEIQTTDNFVDWTSLSVVEITDILFDSRTIPVGVDSEISIGTLTLETPIWISPPSKVKRMGIIHDIIMNVHDDSYSFETDVRVNISGFDVFVHAVPNSPTYALEFIDPTTIIQELARDNPSKEAFKKIGSNLNWRILIDMYPGKFRAGYSQVFLTQPNGNEIVGTVAIDQTDETRLLVNFDQDTYPTNTVIVGPSITKGTIDAIIDPDRYVKTPIAVGTRYLLLNPITDPVNDFTTNERTWPVGFTANANDVIEWNGETWNVVMDSVTVTETVYTTNIKTGVQYKFENGEWVRSFEGEYSRGGWRLVL